MTHPLTDEIIEEIEMRAGGPCERCNDALNMRAAYDLAVEQITEQWEELMDSSKTDVQMIREFDKRLKAMRPQENN